MKKNLLLIPTIAAIAVTPMISLSSCVVHVGGGDKPEPVPPEPVYLSVTFVSNGGSEVPTQHVTSGDKAVEPKDPIWDGRTFDGWYDNEELSGDAFNFASTTITANLVLYAKWTTTEIYQINFQTEKDVLTIDNTSGAFFKDYVGTIKLNNKYSTNFILPEEREYYSVTLGSEPYDGFILEKIPLSDRAYDMKITIPKKDLTQSITINVVPEANYLTLTSESDDWSVAYEVDLFNCEDLSDIYICYDLAVEDPIWVEWNGDNITLQSNQKLYLWNKSTTLSYDLRPTSNAYSTFFFEQINKPTKVLGNIMSMINFGNLYEDSFDSLFDGRYGSYDVGNCIINAPKLPTTNLAARCYQYMFKNCWCLTTTYNLSTTNFFDACYYQMFRGCENLKIKDGNPDQNDRLILDLSDFSSLPDNAVFEMFQGCYSGGGYFTGTPQVGHKYYLDVE